MLKRFIVRLLIVIIAGIIASNLGGVFLFPVVFVGIGWIILGLFD